MPGLTHECPKNGCDRELPQAKLACPDHWADVPKSLQRQLTAAWRKFFDNPRHYREVREQCIAAMNGVS